MGLSDCYSPEAQMRFSRVCCVTIDVSVNGGISGNSD